MSPFDPEHDAPHPASLEEETEPPTAPSPLGLDFVESFHHLAALLHQTPGIVGVHHATFSAISELTLQLIEDGLGHPLSDQIVGLYRLLNGLELGWSTQKGALQGAVHIVDFDTLFGPWLGTLWVEDPGLSAAHRDLLWTLRPIDAPAQAEVWGCIQIQEDDAPDRLFAYHRPSKALTPLDLDLPDYLYCALGAYGTIGWQMTFAPAYDFRSNLWGVPRPSEWVKGLSEANLPVDAAFFLREEE